MKKINRTDKMNKAKQVYLKTKRLRLLLLDSEMSALFETAPDAMAEKLDIMTPSYAPMIKGLNATNAINGESESEIKILERWLAVRTVPDSNSSVNVNDREGRIVIGELMLYTAADDNENGIRRYRYVIYPEYRGNGFAVEATSAFVTNMFDRDIHAYFLLSGLESNNTTSQKALEACGFKQSEIENIRINADNNTDDGNAASDSNAYIVYEISRQATTFSSMFMCVGMSLGMLFGMMTDHMTVGMCIGMAVGMFVGLMIDNNDRKKRADYLKKRMGTDKNADIGA